MQLQNPFTLSTRLLYIDCWQCWMCGGNGQDVGGLEIHHITGRDSNSAFNSSCLCKKCHTTIEHTHEREAELFLKTLMYLYNIEYMPTTKDYAFLSLHKYLLTEDALTWLNQ